MRTRWARRAAVALVLLAAAVAAETTPSRPPPAGAGTPPVHTAPGFTATALPADPNDGVAWTNYLRSFGENLPAITTSAELAAAPQRHAEWLAAFHVAGDPYCAHGEDATHVWPAGEDHTHNVLFCGPPSLGAAIQGWVDTPYHGAGFVDPTVGAIGFGFAVDTSTARFAMTDPPALSRWPRPGGVLPSPAMTGGESPDPRAACGYGSGPVGRPIFLTLPAVATFSGSSISGPAGPVAHCALHANPFETGAPLLESGDATRQVALLAQTPYAAGQTYTAAVAIGDASYSWSFVVAAVPDAPAVAAAPTGAGQITVSWTPPNAYGLAIGGYRIDNVTTGQTQFARPDQTEATFVGLTPGASYEFRAIATNDLGEGRAAAASATALDLPAAPSIVTAIPGGASVFLSWSSSPTPTAPITSFQLELDGGPPSDVGYIRDDTLSGLTPAHTYVARVRAVNSAGSGGWSAPVTFTTLPAGRLFHGLPVPVRALDSRQSGGALAAGSTRVVPVAAATGAAPGAVAAISVNLTATGSTGPGYFTAWPCDQPRPEASSLNYGGGEPGVPNHVVIPVATDGTICVYAGVSGADVIVDVDGWFSTGAGLQAETPHRTLDTRSTGGPRTDAAVAVAPPGARAVVVNLTAAGGSTAGGYVTAYACGPPPLASNLNFTAGQVTANAAIVPVAADGSLCLHANTPTDLVVDVAGYFTDNFAPTGPTRVLDTRDATGPATTVDVGVAPPGAAGVVVNVTAAGGSTVAGFVTVHPPDVETPPTSNLNFAAGQVVPNLALVRPDSVGVIRLAASAPVQLIVDVAGFFS